MAQEDQGCANAGCGCVALIVVAGLLLAGIEAYAAAFDGTRLIIGAFLGSLAGAGGAVLVPFFGQAHRKKAEIGPLRWQDCINSAAKLREKYL
ncbi:MAG: hypothetical protein GX575_08420 [Candidatus Anammoximicrobium sp.]|nr:hypothetical protein [Candidatus Anammoximicrobium sp.]